MIALSPALIDQFAQSFVDGGRALRGNLTAVADSLYGSLLLLTLSWFGVNVLLESLAGDNLDRVLTQLLRFLFLAGLVAWFLQAYDFVFYEGIYRGCEAVALAVAGNGGDAQGFATAWSVFADIIITVWDSLVASPDRFVSGATPFSWAFWGALGGWLVTCSLLLAALAILVLALVILAVIHVMGSALVGLALALGPFFIPWMLWDVTKDYFMAWVRFLFIACLYRVVAVAVLAMARPVFAQLHQWVTGNAQVLGNASAADSMALAVMLIVVASILAYLMSHVPQIAAALVGHARVDTGFATGASRSIQSRIGKANDAMARRIKAFRSDSARSEGRNS
jgi:hypothetical protein